MKSKIILLVSIIVHTTFVFSQPTKKMYPGNPEKKALSYGSYLSGFHNGIDVVASANDTVCLPVSGIIAWMFEGALGEWSFALKLNNSDRFRLCFNHLLPLSYYNYEQDTVVNENEPIALIYDHPIYDHVHFSYKDPMELESDLNPTELSFMNFS